MILGKDKNILHADNISIVFTTVKEIDGLTFYKGLNKYAISCVSDGKGNYAHGKSFGECRRELIFKTTDRDTSKYKGIDRSKQFELIECELMYHVITGSCSTGIGLFVSELGKEIKETYSVNEIIQLVTVKKAYRYDVFVRFWDKN